MTKRTKKCKTCNAYGVIYREVWGKLQRCRQYYCALHERPIEANEYCDSWTEREKAYDLSAQRFDNAEDDGNYFLAHIDELTANK